MGYIISFIIIGVLIGIDQVTKGLATSYLQSGSIPVIPNVLELTYVQNRGAAFGVFQNQRWLFIVITGAFILFLLKLLFFNIPNEKKYFLLKGTLITLIAGAIGNLIDRSVQGYVTDMIYFKPIDFPVFNVADMYVVCSSILMVILILTVYKEDDLLK